MLRHSLFLPCSLMYNLICFPASYSIRRPNEMYYYINEMMYFSGLVGKIIVKCNRQIPPHLFGVFQYLQRLMLDSSCFTSTRLLWNGLCQNHLVKKNTCTVTFYIVPLQLTATFLLGNCWFVCLFVSLVLFMFLYLLEVHDVAVASLSNIITAYCFISLVLS